MNIDLLVHEARSLLSRAATELDENDLCEFMDELEMMIEDWRYSDNVEAE